MVIMSHVNKSTHEGLILKLFLCIAARDIKIVKKLEDVEVMEKESAAFVCEVSHDDVECHWYKGSAKLKVSDNIKMRQEGKVCMHLKKTKNFYSFVVISFTQIFILTNQCFYNTTVNCYLYLIPGKTYVLLFKCVTPEDIGEIKFTAEKASSVAKLKVKGKQIFVLSKKIHG